LNSWRPARLLRRVFTKLHSVRIVLRQAFLGERKRPDGLERIIPDKPYIKSALAEELGQFGPTDHSVFFSRATHREPMLPLCHDDHSIDLARMQVIRTQAFTIHG
jgi:hypothetical protein